MITVSDRVIYSVNTGICNLKQFSITQLEGGSSWLEEVPWV